MFSIAIASIEAPPFAAARGPRVKGMRDVELELPNTGALTLGAAPRPATRSAHDRNDERRDEGAMLGAADDAHDAQKARDALLDQASGNALDMRAIYERYVATIYRFVYARLGNREEAEDVTSQIFIKALRALDMAREAQSVERWLFQVARTTIADHWRRVYAQPERSLDNLLAAGWDSQGEADDAPPISAHERAQAILRELPPRYREVLTYRFLLNYSVKETAAKMNLSEANVKVVQFRALKRASQIEWNATPQRGNGPARAEHEQGGAR